ncbi:hypothetical protein ALC62_01897 [Cyphomyrmex costatus]|uniref:Uncharacterized protein n=1 Tax=Cyphomyrmex costatus TaxID=456900 RepID=A0A151INU4_9HYME|nr:hypothetical protein ALC62_01897 [Cyphomyrmex costatus]
MLSTLGMNGKACLLRAICEVQGHHLNNFGLIGEMLKLFFTANRSPFANLLNEYVEAENRGKFHGDCWPYFKDCPKSLFLPSNNKYQVAKCRGFVIKSKYIVGQILRCLTSKIKKKMKGLYCKRREKRLREKVHIASFF